MHRGAHFLERMADGADLTEVPAFGQSVVEIAGEHRVLIENHFGIRAYSQEKIIVKVKFGFVTVCGCGLELMKMTKDQLVIRGKINAIALQRRG